MSFASRGPAEASITARSCLVARRGEWTDQILRAGTYPAVPDIRRCAACSHDSNHPAPGFRQQTDAAAGKPARLCSLPEQRAIMPRISEMLMDTKI
jgi:hypothetical protein